MNEEIQCLKDIAKELDSNKKLFEPQPDSYGRRFHYVKDGAKKAYIWFKWALGGWNVSFYDEPDGRWKERGPIQSKEQLLRLFK